MTAAPIYAQEPTLADFMSMLIAMRRRLFVGAVLGVLCGFAFLAVCVPQYRVTMLVAPAERAAGADVKALLPDNPSFALQYLVNTMGSQDSIDFIRFENILRGPAVSAELIGDPRIISGMESSGLFQFSFIEKPDTPEKLAAMFQEKIKVQPVGNTPLRRISFMHRDPDFALYFLERIYDVTDQKIRTEIESRANDRAVYLKTALEKTMHPDHRRALTSLLMEQEHISMILAMNEPFSAIMAEPPSVSPRVWWPRRGFVLAGFVLAGLILAAVSGGMKRRVMI